MKLRKFKNLSSFNISNTENNFTEAKLHALAEYIPFDILENFVWTSEHDKIHETLSIKIFGGENCSQLESNQIKTLIFKTVINLDNNNVLYPLFIISLFSISLPELDNKINETIDDFKAFTSIFEIASEFILEQVEKANNLKLNK